MKKLHFFIVVMMLVVVSTISAQNITTSLNANRNIAAGIPVKIVDSNDHIIDRPQYVVSYSKELNVAN
jgi:hypothetical protein